MTLANCKRLFEHYKKVGDAANAAEMQRRINLKNGKDKQTGNNK